MTIALGESIHRRPNGTPGGEVVRARLAQRPDPRAVKVLEGYRLDKLLLELKYTPQVTLSDAELRFFGQQLRADEVLLARVSQQDGMITRQPRLPVFRSWGMQQPLPTVRGTVAGAKATDLQARLGALEISVRAVRRHPTDSRVYVQYLQLLGVHALPRSTSRSPSSSSRSISPRAPPSRSPAHRAATRPLLRCWRCPTASTHVPTHVPMSQPPHCSSRRAIRCRPAKRGYAPTAGSRSTTRPACSVNRDEARRR